MSRGRIPRRRLIAGLAGIAGLALLLRFLALGWRVFHWDEARVGYWTLRYLETGKWEYRAIVHGPLLFHVNEFLFGTLGSSDAVARSFVAAVGGLLPLSAWWFRSRLEDVEVIALGMLLAVEPTLLYYSRFMRNDLLVAGFALAALGLAVRFIDERRNRALYGAVFAFALALGTKEIAIVYLAVWVGAAALLLDRRLFLSREAGWTWKRTARRIFDRVYRGLSTTRWPLLFAAIELLVVIVLLYAPRPDLYGVLGDPASLPGVVGAATIGSAEKVLDIWIQGGHEHSYVAYLLDALETTAFVSLPLVGFAVLGFLVDRYSGDSPRDLVAFAFYWGTTVFFLYPAITDISAPWSLVHAILPLAIPAAVGIRLVVDRGLEAWAAQDTVSVAIVVIVLVAVVGQVGMTAYQTSYAAPQDDDNPLVQYGQPAGHLQDTMDDVDAIAAATEGTDVLFYGDHFSVYDESVADVPPANSDWLNRLPLAWYLERADVTTESATSTSAIEDPPPVVIARVKHYGDLEPVLSSYDAGTYEITSRGTETVFFIDRTALNRTERAT
jgi:uncharacterized protein (TIGR03663 family)